ncbi:GAF domain-containing protein [Sorangium sp. So ce1036]|uniref:GAF domain-containing protein n=1 Tax=Sorangium sp. So ce1036 TaxID=3133328 RepID=UPI003F001948
MADLNDPARLAALHGAMLRTDADAILDDCVAQAARLARAPIAFVSLVLRHIQLLRAHHGLPLELAVSCATSRSDSFCQLVVLDEAPLIVEDALRDARVPKALVEHFGIRAYAGVPVRVHGHVVGSLCVLDVVPRRFEPRVQGGLDQLALDVSQRLSALVEGVPASCTRRGSAETCAAAKERLVRIEQATRVLERALLAIAPVVAVAQGPAPAWAPVSPAGRAGVTPGDLRAAVGCWHDMGPVAEELCEDAAAFERDAPFEAASGMTAAARALARDLAELGPLVRLAEGVLDGVLDGPAAAKGTRAVRSASDAHQAASAAVRQIRARLERMRSAPAGSAAAPTGSAA